MTLYLAGILIVIGVALFVAAPLTGGFSSARGKMRADLEAEAAERERGLATQALRELEFDREMGKLTEDDYLRLKGALEQRALSAMATLERVSRALGGPRLKSLSGRAPRASAAAIGRAFNFCPQCGARALAAAKFCVECGTAMSSKTPAARRIE